VRSLSMHEHKLAIGMIILVMLAILDASALTLVICINWATLPGPEAGIVASIITAVVTGINGHAGSVVGYYFGATPPEGN